MYSIQITQKQAIMKKFLVPFLTVLLFTACTPKEVYMFSSFNEPVVIFMFADKF